MKSDLFFIQEKKKDLEPELLYLEIEPPLKEELPKTEEEKSNVIIIQL